MTNGDKIRSMSDEELAEWLHRIIKQCLSDNTTCTSDICPLFDACAKDPFWTEKWIESECIGI